MQTMQCKQCKKAYYNGSYIYFSDARK